MSRQLAMSWSEWSAHDGVALAGRVRGGELRADEVVAQAVAAVERVDGRLEGVLEIFEDVVRDANANRPARDGALYGVPLFLKDLGSRMAGRTQESGSRLMRGNVSEVTDPLVENFLRAGLIPLGRSTTPEFGMTFDTSTDYLGRPKVTRNPWNPERTPGGLLGGLRRPCCGRRDPGLHGLRRRRLDPNPRLVLRPGGAQGFAGAGLDAAQPQRVHVAHRGRRRGHPFGARQRRGARLPASQAERRHLLSDGSAGRLLAGGALACARAPPHRALHRRLGRGRGLRPRRSWTRCGSSRACSKVSDTTSRKSTTRTCATGRRCGKGYVTQWICSRMNYLPLAERRAPGHAARRAALAHRVAPRGGGARVLHSRSPPGDGRQQRCDPPARRLLRACRPAALPDPRNPGAARERSLQPPPRRRARRLGRAPRRGLPLHHARQRGGSARDLAPGRVGPRRPARRRHALRRAGSRGPAAPPRRGGGSRAPGSGSRQAPPVSVVA